MATAKSNTKEAPSKTASKTKSTAKEKDTKASESKASAAKDSDVKPAAAKEKSSAAEKKTSTAKAKSGTAKSGTAKESTAKKSSSSKSESATTTDHEEIRKWAEARGGKPSTVAGTGKKNDSGILRIDFPGYSGKDTLEEISWEDFFKKFDESDLQFLYQEKTAAGKESRFNKFVSKS